MKNSTFSVFAIILFAFCSSCAKIKPTQTEKTITLGVNNLKQLNGYYSNIAGNKTEKQKNSLWRQINFLQKDTIANWEKHKVEFEVINKKRIKVKLWLEDMLVSEKVLKGRIKPHYFSTRTKAKRGGVPLIYYFESDSKFEIGIRNDNRLVVNRASNTMGMIFIISAGNTQQFTGIYRKE